MRSVHLVAVAAVAAAVRVLRVRAAVDVDQDVRMCAMAAVDVWGVLQLVWRAALINVMDLVQELVSVVVLAALAVAVVVVAADARAHVEDARLAVHVQIYVQVAALAHAMQGVAAAVRRLVCHRVRAHVLRLVQGSRQYQLLLIKGRYRYEN